MCFVDLEKAQGQVLWVFKRCWFFFFFYFNDVFSVSFWESGGKLVHIFCLLSSSVLRHSTDPHQIVPNCDTKASFPVTIFVFFLRFSKYYSYFYSWPRAPPHTWLAIILYWLTLGYFYSSAHMSIIHVPICVRFKTSAVPLSDLTQSLSMKPAG